MMEMEYFLCRLELKQLLPILSSVNWWTVLKSICPTATQETEWGLIAVPVRHGNVPHSCCGFLNNGGHSRGNEPRIHSAFYSFNLRANGKHFKQRWLLSSGRDTGPGPLVEHNGVAVPPVWIHTAVTEYACSVIEKVFGYCTHQKKYGSVKQDHVEPLWTEATVNVTMQTWFIE